VCNLGIRVSCHARTKLNALHAKAISVHLDRSMVLFGCKACADGQCAIDRACSAPSPSPGIKLRAHACPFVTRKSDTSPSSLSPSPCRTAAQKKDRFSVVCVREREEKQLIWGGVKHSLELPLSSWVTSLPLSSF
jgi:hypothetical protein